MVGVGAIIFKEDRVLLVQRGRPPAYGKWSLPGGLVELGESLENAVQREVLEEVGLNVRVQDLLAVLDRVILDRHGRIEYHYVLLDFLCFSDDGEPHPASDALSCQFVPMDSLLRYEMTNGTVEVIQRAHQQINGYSFPIYDASI